MGVGSFGPESDLFWHILCLCEGCLSWPVSPPIGKFLNVLLICGRLFEQCWGSSKLIMIL